MVNGNGTFVYNGYDADGSWYAPEESVKPRVYHEKAREKNIKDILYPELFPENENSGDNEDNQNPIDPNPGPEIPPVEPDDTDEPLEP
jgi:hypothetical protein